jgi:hypothetical protein
MHLSQVMGPAGQNARRFNGMQESYLPWRIRMMTLLKAKGLSNFVNDKDPLRPKNIEPETWSRKEGKAQAILLESMEDYLLPALSDLTAFQIWKNLEEKYFSKSLLRQNRLRIFEEKMEVFIAKIENLVKELNMIGGTISDAEKLAVIQAQAQHRFPFIFENLDLFPIPHNQSPEASSSNCERKINLA